MNTLPSRSERFIELITSPSSLAALKLSLQTSTAATLLCLLFGVPMALVLARTEFPGQRVVRSLVLLPLVLPPVVGGLALLYTFGRRGLLGGAGLDIAFTSTAVVLAQTFVAAPFYVRAASAAFAAVDEELLLVARTLGASRARVMAT